MELQRQAGLKFQPKGLGLLLGALGSLGELEQARDGSGPCGGWTGGREEVEARVRGKWFAPELVTKQCVLTLVQLQGYIRSPGPP